MILKNILYYYTETPFKISLFGKKLHTIFFNIQMYNNSILSCPRNEKFISGDIINN